MAATLVDGLIRRQEILFLLQSFAEFFRATTRKRVLTAEASRAFVDGWWSVAPSAAYEAADLFAAMDAVIKHKLSPFDALIWATAERAGVTYLRDRGPAGWPTAGPGHVRRPVCRAEQGPSRPGLSHDRRPPRPHRRRHHRRRHRRLLDRVPPDQARHHRRPAPGASAAHLRDDVARGRARGPAAGDAADDGAGEVHLRAVRDAGGGDRAGDRVQAERVALGGDRTPSASRSCGAAPRWGGASGSRSR